MSQNWFKFPISEWYKLYIETLLKCLQSGRFYESELGDAIPDLMDLWKI